MSESPSERRIRLLEERNEIIEDLKAYSKKTKQKPESAKDDLNKLVSDKTMFQTVATPFVSAGRGVVGGLAETIPDIINIGRGAMGYKPWDVGVRKALDEAHKKYLPSYYPQTDNEKYASRIGELTGEAASFLVPFAGAAKGVSGAAKLAKFNPNKFTKGLDKFATKGIKSSKSLKSNLIAGGSGKLSEDVYEETKNPLLALSTGIAGNMGANYLINKTKDVLKNFANPQKLRALDKLGIKDPPLSAVTDVEPLQKLGPFSGSSRELKYQESVKDKIKDMISLNKNFLGKSPEEVLASFKKDVRQGSKTFRDEIGGEFRRLRAPYDKALETGHLEAFNPKNLEQYFKKNPIELKNILGSTYSDKSSKLSKFLHKKLLNKSVIDKLAQLDSKKYSGYPKKMKDELRRKIISEEPNLFKDQISYNDLQLAGDGILDSLGDIVKEGKGSERAYAGKILSALQKDAHTNYIGAKNKKAIEALEKANEYYSLHGDTYNHLIDLKDKKNINNFLTYSKDLILNKKNATPFYVIQNIRNDKSRREVFNLLLNDMFSDSKGNLNLNNFRKSLSKMEMGDNYNPAFNQFKETMALVNNVSEKTIDDLLDVITHINKVNANINTSKTGLYNTMVDLQKTGARNVVDAFTGYTSAERIKNAVSRFIAPVFGTSLYEFLSKPQLIKTLSYLHKAKTVDDVINDLKKIRKQSQNPLTKKMTLMAENSLKKKKASPRKPTINLEEAKKYGKKSFIAKNLLREYNERHPEE